MKLRTNLCPAASQQKSAAGKYAVKTARGKECRWQFIASSKKSPLILDTVGTIPKQALIQHLEFLQCALIYPGDLNEEARKFHLMLVPEADQKEIHQEPVPRAGGGKAQSEDTRCLPASNIYIYIYVVVDRKVRVRKFI